MPLDDVLDIDVHINMACHRREAVAPPVIWSNAFVCHSNIAPDPFGQAFAGLAKMPTVLFATAGTGGIVKEWPFAAGANVFEQALRDKMIVQRLLAVISGFR